MITTTAADLIRNFPAYLDTVETSGEAIAIVRNNREVARLIPGSIHQTALEAMADIYMTLPEAVGSAWLADSRDGQQSDFDEEIKDPWAI